MWVEEFLFFSSSEEEYGIALLVSVRKYQNDEVYLLEMSTTF